MGYVPSTSPAASNQVVVPYRRYSLRVADVSSHFQLGTISSFLILILHDSGLYDYNHELTGIQRHRRDTMLPCY